MGNTNKVMIANSTDYDCWVWVGVEKSYLDKIEFNAKASYKQHLEAGGGSGFDLSPEGTLEGGVTLEYSHVKIKPGFGRIGAGASAQRLIPDNQSLYWVSAIASNGQSFGGPLPYERTNLSYFNLVLCSDYTMRSGFKNKVFRVSEGLQQYYGPYVCPGCKQQRCTHPIVSASGSDGACELEPVKDRNM